MQVPLKRINDLEKYIKGAGLNHPAPFKNKTISTMKMKLQLSPFISDIFITLYLITFLFFRFSIENQFRGKYMISILFGGMTILFLWAMIKKKFLNPNYFGLLNSTKPSSRKIKSNN